MFPEPAAVKLGVGIWSARPDRKLLENLTRAHFGERKHIVTSANDENSRPAREIRDPGLLNENLILSASEVSRSAEWP
jgi:hypothetical protein